MTVATWTDPVARWADELTLWSGSAWTPPPTSRIRWRVSVAGVDLSCDALAGSVLWGRDDVDSQPDASTCSLTFADPSGAVAAGLEIGQTVAVYAILPSVELQRFAGELVDIVTDHAAAETTLAASGPLARLSRVLVGAGDYPAELDGARVARILSDAGDRVSGGPRWVDVDPATTWNTYGPGAWRELTAPTIDTGTVTVRSRAGDATAAATLLRDTAESSAGVVYELRDGTIAYRDRSARTRAVDVDASACRFLSAATFARTTSGLVNGIETEYGEEGNRSKLTVENAESVATFGRFDRRWSTELATFTDADRLSREIVNRRAAPGWAIDVLTYDSLAGRDDATEALMRAELGDTLRVFGIAAPTPAPELLVVVEGARETIEPGSWLVELAASDARLSVLSATWTEHSTQDPGRRWVDVPAGVSWADADTLLPTS